MSRPYGGVSLEGAVYEILKGKIDKFAAPVLIPREYVENPKDDLAARSRPVVLVPGQVPDDSSLDTEFLVNVAGRNNTYRSVLEASQQGEGLHMMSYELYVDLLSQFWYGEGRPLDNVPAFKDFRETYVTALEDDEVEQFNAFAKKRRIYVISEADLIKKHFFTSSAARSCVPQLRRSVR